MVTGVRVKVNAPATNERSGAPGLWAVKEVGSTSGVLGEDSPGAEVGRGSSLAQAPPLAFVTCGGELLAVAIFFPLCH